MEQLFTVIERDKGEDASSFVRRVWREMGVNIDPDKPVPHEVVVKRGYNSPYRFARIMREKLDSPDEPVFRMNGQYYAFNQGVTCAVVYDPNQRADELLSHLAANQPARDMTVQEAEAFAREAGKPITGRAIRHAAQVGHIPGARKSGRDWLIPYEGFNHYLDNRPRPGRNRGG